jgi:hypothetical protein
MSAYWVRFENGKTLCVEGQTEDLARARAVTVGPVQSIRTLPYPARPRMEPFETWEWQGRTVTTPELCHSPAKCAGRTSCPQNYACSE